jgi:hypothetical protein
MLSLDVQITFDSGIKIGRYTYEKRTQDIVERRRFDEMQRQLEFQQQQQRGDAGGCSSASSIGETGFSSSSGGSEHSRASCETGSPQTTKAEEEWRFSDDDEYTEEGEDIWLTEEEAQRLIQRVVKAHRNTSQWLRTTHVGEEEEIHSCADEKLQSVEHESISDHSVSRL